MYEIYMKQPGHLPYGINGQDYSCNRNGHFQTLHFTAFAYLHSILFVLLRGEADHVVSQLWPEIRY